MKDKTLLGGLIFTGVGMLAFILLWVFVLRDSEVASTPLTSLPVTINDPSATVFEMNPALSEVQFTLNEVLRGVPTKVVGFTNQVSGQIAVNPDDLTTAAVGEIMVNARTLQTDNDFRNTAMRSRILFTSTYEFIHFVPLRIDGLPDSATTGENLTFQLSGDLIIKDITQPVTFTVTAVLSSPTRLEGTASTTVDRTDFSLAIPEVSGVANVDETVSLEIAFVAEAIN